MKSSKPRPSGLSPRKRQFLWILATLAFLGALIGLSAWRRQPEERAVVDFTASVIDRGNEPLSTDEQSELRRQWERFSPQTRREVLRAIVRHELERFRAETAVLTPDERSRRIEDETRRLRTRRERLTPEQKARIRERLESDEGRDLVRQLLALHQTELTARERAELDPLLHEWLQQTERMMRE